MYRVSIGATSCVIYRCIVNFHIFVSYVGKPSALKKIAKKIYDIVMPGAKSHKIQEPIVHHRQRVSTLSTRK